MSDVGTLDWARRSGGRLSWQERFGQVRAGFVAQLGLLPKPWRRRMPVDPAVALPAGPPDSEAARGAYAHAEQVSPPWLMGHALRTWLYGELSAACRGIGHDEELLYVICVLHDLGLTETHEGKNGELGCFAVEGAYVAGDFLSACGWPEERATAVAEAVSLHLNITVPMERHGPEAHLLNEGAGLDVVGRRLNELPRAQVKEIESRHPRDGFYDGFADLMAKQARTRPDSRAALMWKLGFKRYMRED